MGQADVGLQRAKALSNRGGGQRFLSSHLVPVGMLPGDRRATMIVEALYFREKQLGYILFEEGAERIVTRTAHLVGTPGENPLRGEISSALQGALLVQQIQVHAAELVRKQYIWIPLWRTFRIGLLQGSGGAHYRSEQSPCDPVWTP